MDTSSEQNFLTDTERWNALIQRDRTAQEHFLYAVKTTGIYCRPGCSSRLPKRENVEFFDSCEAAEQRGYRPCKRCRPNAISLRGTQAQIVARACRLIAEAESPPTLHALAGEVGLSPYHFHRLFKSMVGVTPKQYASARRMQRFRDELHHDGTVTEAIYQAGFNSSSRAYENATDRLGMLPSTYKHGAPGLDIRFAGAPCFLGWLLVAATERGICAIEFDDTAEALVERLHGRFPKARLRRGRTRFCHLGGASHGFYRSARARFKLALGHTGQCFSTAGLAGITSYSGGRYRQLLGGGGTHRQSASGAGSRASLCREQDCCGYPLPSSGAP